MFVSVQAIEGGDFYGGQVALTPKSFDIYLRMHSIQGYICLKIIDDNGQICYMRRKKEKPDAPSNT